MDEIGQGLEKELFLFQEMGKALFKHILRSKQENCIKFPSGEAINHLQYLCCAIDFRFSANGGRGGWGVGVGTST